MKFFFNNLEYEKNIDDDKISTLEGCICLPEYSLFIDSPMYCMVIHALGCEKPNINAIWHYVIPFHIAHDLDERGIMPKVINKNNNPFYLGMNKVLNIKIEKPQNSRKTLKVSRN